MNKITKNSEKLNLSEFLKEKRTLVGLTQGQVAKELGYSTAQFVSNWERGVSSPPLNALRKLAQMYKVDEEEMFESFLAVTLQEVSDSLRKRYYSVKMKA